MTSVAEEKAFNARLGGGADERDFVGHMTNMKLPHPGKIAIALPGNMRSGQPRERATRSALGTGSAQLRRAPELLPSWLAEHRNAVTVLDVRSEDEVEGPDGRIETSLHIPLQDLEQRQAELPSDRPLVVVCHAGSRSALATQQLLKAGFDRVANLRGGLLRWSDEGYPLVGCIHH